MIFVWEKTPPDPTVEVTVNGVAWEYAASLLVCLPARLRGD